MSLPSGFPDLVSERLLLRRLSLSDADDIFLLRSDDMVNQYLGRKKAESLQDAEEFINRVNFASDNQQSLYWGICLQDSGKLVGTICLWNFTPQGDRAEIGYELLPKHHNKGIMQEALSKVLEFGFKQLQLSAIEAWTSQLNIRSTRILERNGFVRDMDMEKNIDRSVEGPDIVIYSLTSEQFS
ncbi:MAG: GNAT family N-acetyltransferase [Flavisolibacter sp.]